MEEAVDAKHFVELAALERPVAQQGLGHGRRPAAFALGGLDDGLQVQGAGPPGGVCGCRAGHAGEQDQHRGRPSRSEHERLAQP